MSGRSRQIGRRDHVARAGRANHLGRAGDSSTYLPPVGLERPLRIVLRWLHAGLDLRGRSRWAQQLGPGQGCPPVCHAQCSDRRRCWALAVAAWLLHAFLASASLVEGKEHGLRRDRPPGFDRGIGICGRREVFSFFARAARSLPVRRVPRRFQGPRLREPQELGRADRGGRLPGGRARAGG